MIDVLLKSLDYALDVVTLDLFRNPERRKHRHEFTYWRIRKLTEKQLSHSHYEHFYTTHFGFDREFYTGKRVLDIGCGPRGSLEWATMSKERVGLDPLADMYKTLGANKHGMQYSNAHSEEIPFPDGHFDIVCSFNSLDHVDVLERTIQEIIRVIAPGGYFLLLSELNHDPTPYEPIVFSWDIGKRFSPFLKVLEERYYEKRGGLYDSIRKAAPYDHGNEVRRYGIISAKFVKPGSSN